jgi:hypothetical protein
MLMDALKRLANGIPHFSCSETARDAVNEFHQN